MIRRTALAIICVTVYLMTLGVLDHLDGVTKAQFEQQRYFIAHQ